MSPIRASSKFTGLFLRLNSDTASNGGNRPSETKDGYIGDRSSTLVFSTVNLKA
jgi:hypothetical protein